MKHTIVYVTYPSEQTWGSDFTFNALLKNSKNNIISWEKKQTLDHDSIIHFHNIQIIRKMSYRPIKFIQKLQRDGHIVIGGLRGRMSVKKDEKLLKTVDGIACGSDPFLLSYSKQINEFVECLPAGVDSSLFRKLNVPKTSYLSWIGRSHKKFKNFNIIQNLGFSFSYATYENYVPHHLIPEFLCHSFVHVVTSNHEGFCRPIVEAALCELPVVSTDVGVAKEILDPEFIVSVPPNPEDYRNILDNLTPDQMKQAGKNNKKRAEKYSWKNIVPIYDTFWDYIWSELN